MEPGNRKELRMMGYGLLFLIIALAVFVVFCGVAPASSAALGVIAACKPRWSVARVRIIIPAHRHTTGALQ